MKYIVNNKDILLKEPKFNLSETLDCGQAFRWSQIDDTSWHGYALNDYLELKQLDEGILFKDTSEEFFLTRWVEYFDLNTNYELLKEMFSSTDITLKMACEYASGIRLLRQDPWECLISFIISQNNNIPRIKLIISRLCEHYNRFPTVEQMKDETIESIDYLKSGFRAKYIIDAVQKVYSKEVDLQKVSTMNIELARNELIKIKGVGAKVSECVLLFGMHRTEAFPIDVWIKRVLKEYYPTGFPKSLYEYQGIAQQFLFHYIRNLERSKQ
ncbi:MAG: DNA-3-methyladenine glycosylase 2 family protein [Ruminococcus sp.]|nr:DNA-3-methyladenine glycosylase 2 family protein [Ruminococcus sp.]MCD7799634.1 DNA-3-methyladenine glycosylase 2 family protein [Ruminococcus sp.]